MHGPFRYTLGRGDFEALEAEIVRRSRTQRIARVAVIAAIVLNLALSLHFAWPSLRGERPFEWVMLANAGMGAALASWIAYARLVLRPRRIERAMLYGKTMELRFDADGIESRFEGGEGRTAWSAFLDRSRSDTHAFFWTARLVAVVVPLGAMGEEAKALWRLSAPAEGKIPT